MPTVLFNSNSFKTIVIEEQKTAIVDFSASWCSPCKMMEPVVDELSKQLEGKMIVGKIDIEQSADLGEAFKIISVPTFVLFRSGKEVKRVSGVQSVEKLLKELQ